MKAFLVLLLLCGALVAALFVPVGGLSFWARAQQRGIPAALARATAHGLRAGWNLLSSVGQRPEPPARPQKRKAQAAAAPVSVHRGGREGIVAQPPKEKLGQADRAALDALVTNAR